MKSAEKARPGRWSPGAAPGRSLSLPAVSAAARLRYAGRCIAVALACGMLLSPALWLTRPLEAPLTESFPMVPPVGGLEVLDLPAPFDAALAAAVLALCAVAAALPRRLVFTTLFLACLLLAAPDLMRWQPWFYLYLVAIGALAFVPRRASRAAFGGSRLPRLLAWLEPLQVMRLLVASVYFYSGLNKANAAFFEERLSGFLAGMPAPIAEGPVATALTYSAPGLEMAAGLGLLLGGYRLRYTALALAVSTNLLVLVTLTASASNIVVWPWNAAMIILVITLFAGQDEEAAPARTKPLRRAPGLLPGYIYAVAICILFFVMPATGLLGYWPSYLSFALYSQNTPEASVTVDGRLTSVTTISYEVLNVPAYPDPAIYQAVAQRSCATGSQGSTLIIRDAPDLLTGHRERREYTCAELREIP